MCNFWTCLLTADGKVHSSAATSSHEELIKRLKLDDGKPGDECTAEAIRQRQFVRLEVTPRTTLGIASKDEKDWALKVDEEGTLPEWFLAKRKEHEAAVWKAWQTAMKETLWKLRIERLPKLIAEIKAIPYFSMNSPPNPEWKMHYGKTWNAAGNTAKDAAVDATRNAAGNAAWTAARDAARIAARDAARNAAGDAAWDTALWALIQIMPTGAKIDQKHIAHINARMEVWRKGYGLMCDVGGILYCYGIKAVEKTGTKEGQR